MLSEITVPKDMVHNWLYYETGFEQLHPYPHIISWMEEQGYAYGIDWKVTYIAMDYFIVFPNSKIAALFVARWL
jgi:hypothetical protein